MFKKSKWLVVYDDYNSINIQALDTNDFEGCAFSKMLRPKSSGNM